MDLTSLSAQLLRTVLGAEGAHHAAQAAPPAIHDVSYLWLIPALPLLGAFINAVLGARLQKRFGKPLVSGIAVAVMAGAFLVAAVAFFQLLGMEGNERYLRDHLWTMITAGELRADLAFALDPLSMMMTLIITFIGTLIHVYSVGYMADDPGYWRFFTYLNLFVFSMLLLVMGDNFALMFFGWEGVGLCSYLLIAFWYEDVEKAKAGMKAFVTNRFGDFGFVLGLFLLFWALGGNWDNPRSFIPSYEQNRLERDADYRPDVARELYQRDGMTEAAKGQFGPTLNFRDLRTQLTSEEKVIRVAVPPQGDEEPSEVLMTAKERLASKEFFGIPIIALAGILMFIGATAKSAQIPLYVWLPDAMAGPTPVSALIHAATMVTAGVYMVARLNFLFALSTTAMTVIAVTGAATALFAATIGIVQNDIKKVLAYSTVSQLGFMFIGVGVGAYWAGVYHLLTHAFFKACLFLGSGSVILGCHHEQDMRKMGGLKKFMPLTERTYLYACIAISGFPIANGFFSKDEILWKAFDSGNNLIDPTLGKIVWAIGWITASLTSFYMWRSYYMTFSGEYRGGGGHEAHPAHNIVPALSTHSVGAAHAGTFDEDVKMSAAGSHSAGAHDVAHGHDDHVHGKAGHADHPDHKAEGAHGHGGLPHESPRSMTYVLATLAVGCFATLFLGFWPPLGHLLHLDWMTVPPLEAWLAPSFGASAELVASRVAQSGSAWEWTLIVLSVGVAFGGWFLARSFYKDAKSTVPARVMARFPGVHRVVFNKYYVDELYGATVLRGSSLLARGLFWFDRTLLDGAVHGAARLGRIIGTIDGAIDKYVVDGAVNLLSVGVLRGGKVLRRVQTGRIQNYLYAALAGALVVIGISYLVR